MEGAWVLSGSLNRIDRKPLTQGSPHWVPLRIKVGGNSRTLARSDGTMKQ